MTDEPLSQSAIDDMLAAVAADGPDAIGPRPTRPGAAASPPAPASLEDLFTAPTITDAPALEPALTAPASHPPMWPAEDPPRRPAVVAFRAEPADLVDRAALDAIDRRLDSLEGLLGRLRGDSAEARRAEEQVRALQAQVSALNSEVRGLQKRIDGLDRRLASIQRRPSRRARRSLWSASLFVDDAGQGRWTSNAS